MTETSATEENLTFALGETWIIGFTARDAAGQRIAPSDLTGLEFQLDRRRGGRVATLTLGDGIEEDGASPPNFEIKVTRARQEGWAAAVYRYRVVATLDNPDQDPSVQAFGTIHARG